MYFNFHDFLRSLLSAKHKYRIKNVNRVRIQKLEPIKREFKDIVEIIENSLKTPKSALAYNNIKRLTILNPSKREGGIMNCYEEDDLVTCDSTLVLKKLLRFTLIISVKNF